MGASSHSYTWRIYASGVLEVTYNNIMLADSNVNEPASHGFFNFEIEQKANNPLGTVINNEASIFFDFNAPIITNTTFHTISDNFLVTIVTDNKLVEEDVQINIYPNPFSNHTTIETTGKEYDNLQFSLYDLTGRELIHKQSYQSNKILLKRGSLNSGIYIFTMKGDGKSIATGKIIVK